MSAWGHSVKAWFPFTNYDFYAYLASGGLALALLDYITTGGAWIARTDLGFIQVALALASAYVLGHLVASASALVLEHWLVKSVLEPPVAVLLGAARPGGIGGWLRRVVVGRYYAPMSETVREKIWTAAATSLGVARESLKDPEAVFQVAFRAARKEEDTRERLDDFRNLYGLCRNIAVVALGGAVIVAARALFAGSTEGLALALGLALVGLGLVGRFLKFYSAFTAEVVRSLLR